MRIGIDATCCWNRRGFGRFAQGLIRALVAGSQDHDWVLLVDREPIDGLLPPGCEVVNARPERPVTESAVAGGRRSIRDLLRCRRVVKRLGTRVFFFPAVYSYFPVPRGPRAVVCVHDTIAEAYPALVFPDRRSRLAWAAKTRLALLQARRVMTVSEASKRDIVRILKVAPDRIDLVTEGPDDQFRRRPDPQAAARAARRRAGVPPGAPYLLAVGGISPHKNLGVLLDALPTVVARHDVHLVLAGDLSADGFLANGDVLQRRVRDDPLLAPRVHWTGFVSEDELVDLYNGALALALPSLLEGFGLPAVEAMACGCPVLASAVGSLPEVVGDAGILFPPHAPDQIASAVLRLLEDPGLRADLALRAEKRSHQFTWARAGELALASLERAAD